MRAGAVRPRFSRITGPLGTFGAGGSAARSAGTSVATSAEPSGSQRGAAPATRSSGASVSRRAAPLATSRTHSSMLSSALRVKATWEPSGDQETLSRRGASGSPRTSRRSPSAVRTRVRPDSGKVRLGPESAGSMRNPARRSSRAASSEIGGSDGRSSSTIQAPRGPSSAVGVGGASTSAVSTGSGVR